MKNHLLVVGIIVLFLGISTIPEINANDNDADDVVDKSIDNFENRSFDYYDEIFTWFSGDAHYEWINKTGPNSGEIIFYTCGWCRGLNYFGFRHFNGLILPFWGFRWKSYPGIHIPYFTKVGSGRLRGYALGNIEYIEY